MEPRMDRYQIGHKGRLSATSQRYRGRWDLTDGIVRPLETDGRLAAISNEHVLPRFLYADLHECGHATLTLQRRESSSEHLHNIANVLSFFTSPETAESFIGDL